MVNDRGLITLSPAGIDILDRLTAAGATPLIVGGTVRDALLSREMGDDAPAPKDVDIEVHGARSYDQLADALTGIGQARQQGRAFGVLAVSVDGEDFDISLPRRESKTGAGHRGFTVDTSSPLTVADAAARRDFTINAIGWDHCTGELVDPHGGAADLTARILRPVSADTFGDDPLRVLRGIQFIARLGLTPDPSFTAIARDLQPRFAELSRERVWGEWRKIARRGRHLDLALTALADTGWVEHFPELDALRHTPQDPAWHPEGDVYRHAAFAADAAADFASRDGLDDSARESAVLAALVHDMGKPEHTQTGGVRITSHGHADGGVEPARRFLTGIGAPQYLIDQILPLVREHMAHASIDGTPTEATVRRLIRRLAGPAGTGPTIQQWARLVEADGAGRGPAARENVALPWLAVADQIGPDPSTPLLTGQHLIDAGLTPGPHFKAILADALTAQDDGAFHDEAGAVAWFTRHSSGQPRQPRGIPAGGQYAQRQRPDSDVSL